MNPFQSLRDYERFVYTLSQSFPNIESSTLTVIQKGRLFAELTGELSFAAGHRLVVYELLAWGDRLVNLEVYSSGKKKMRFYQTVLKISQSTKSQSQKNMPKANYE